MPAFSLSLPGGKGGFGGSGRGNNRRHRARSAADAAGAGNAPQQQSHMSNIIKSGLTSGSLSLAGDVLAQLITNRDKPGSQYDVARAARMGSFGFFFYGPYQYWWYGLLDRSFPGRSVGNFLTKVAANQLLLAPVVITTVFAWNLAWQRQLKDLPRKLRADFLPTMLNGWKFWVPAATINFAAVPLRYQVLYMSTCGMLWTGYLSYSSAKKN